ncbi:hypothetical protein [Rhizocola hellebori]|uniref:hypothetical protein n=1 Tax=Rhizocola hellebori TaxID=1392758 RepID=UPI001944A96D|nr:hypothetical protein [Rhizocola hellebori]
MAFVAMMFSNSPASAGSVTVPRSAVDDDVINNSGRSAVNTELANSAHLEAQGFLGDGCHLAGRGRQTALGTSLDLLGRAYVACQVIRVVSRVRPAKATGLASTAITLAVIADRPFVLGICTTKQPRHNNTVDLPAPLMTYHFRTRTDK